MATFLLTLTRFMKRFFIVIYISLTTLIAAYSQGSPRLYWDADMMAIFDNREGNTAITPSKTFFNTRLAPEIGATFSSSSARHRLAGGVVWFQPIGSEWDGYRLSPTLYYRYEGKSGISASLGMFGRGQLISPLPDFIVSDSVYYNQRNIRGAMIQYQDTRGFAEAFVDWRGMRSRSRREAFSIIAQGQWHHRILTLGGLAMLNHLALSSGNIQGENVVDNLVANPYIGLDWNWRKRPDRRSLTGEIRLGVLTSLTRDRSDREWLPRSAIRFEGEASYRWLMVRNTLTAGRPVFPIYNRYGALLCEGEPYYSARWYDCVSLGANLISTSNVLLRAALDFHITPSDFSFNQRLMLQVSVGSDPRRPRLPL